MEDYIGPNWDRFRTLRKPVVATIRGYALGGRCELAMMCDIVIAARGGQIDRDPSLSEWRVDVGKRGAHLRTGVEAVEPDVLLDEALRICEQIARHSLPVILAIKEAVNCSFKTSLPEGLLFEQRLFHAGFALADQRAGMAAFLGRRDAAFSNR